MTYSHHHLTDVQGRAAQLFLLLNASRTEKKKRRKKEKDKQRRTDPLLPHIAMMSGLLCAKSSSREQ